MVTNLLRLFHTVKYLKIEQVLWRAIKLLPNFITEESQYPQNKTIKLDINYDTMIL